MRVPLTKELRAKIFERDDFTCQYCGRSAPDVALEIDHVIPISKGGTNDENNLVTSCRVCNVRKSDYDCTDELKQKLKELADKPVPHIHKTTQDIYTYPAVFNYADDGISIKFPDLPGCLSCADDNSEAVFMAADALEGRLWSDLCDKIPFPEPSDPLKLKDTLKANQCVTLIRIDMKKLRAKFSGKSANKMVTIPQWLVTEGKEAGINFSQVMQEALMLKLGIKDTSRR